MTHFFSLKTNITIREQQHCILRQFFANCWRQLPLNDPSLELQTRSQISFKEETIIICGCYLFNDQIHMASWNVWDFQVDLSSIPLPPDPNAYLSTYPCFLFSSWELLSFLNVSFLTSYISKSSCNSRILCKDTSQFLALYWEGVLWLFKGWKLMPM